MADWLFDDNFSDDEVDTNPQQSQQQALITRVCPKCSSTEFYESQEGATVCTNCHQSLFTQSQSQRAVIEEGDALELGGKSKFNGGFIEMRRGKRQRKKKENNMRNKIPEFEKCVECFQFVLKFCAVRCAELAGVHPRQRLVDVCGALWFAYLNSWREAVIEYYNNRNDFDEDFDEEQQQQQQRIVFHTFFLNNNQVLKKSEDGMRRRRALYDGLISYYLCKQSNSNNLLSSAEAAVHLKPSMFFILICLYRGLAHLEAGVASWHLIEWVQSGALPLLNAQNIIQGEELRQTARLMTEFFDCMSKNYLKHDSIELYADLLGVATGFDEVKKLNVPLMAARIVKHCNFPQRTLSIALALLGKQTESDLQQCCSNDETNEEESNYNNTNAAFYPPPLWKNHSRCQSTADEILNSIEVAAFIVVACELSEGSDRWSFHYDGKFNQSFIPWNHHEMKYFQNQMLDSYVEFVERYLLPTEPNKLPELNEFFASLNIRNSNNKKKNCLSVANNYIDDDDNNNGKSNAQTDGIEADIINNDNNNQSDDTDQVFTHYKNEADANQKHDQKVPFDANYMLLIEYVSYKCRVDPARLHQAVSDLSRHYVTIDD